MYKLEDEVNSQVLCDACARQSLAWYRHLIPDPSRRAIDDAFHMAGGPRLAERARIALHLPGNPA